MSAQSITSICMFSAVSAVINNLSTSHIGQGIQATLNYYRMYFWINDYIKHYVQYHIIFLSNVWIYIAY